jgi:hypothetical protein
MGVFEDKLSIVGIPNVNCSKVGLHSLPNKELIKIKKFIDGESKWLAIVGNGNFLWSIKIMKMLVIKHLSLDALFANAADLSLNSDLDALCLVNLNAGFPDIVKIKLSNTLLHLLGRNSRILLAAPSSKDLMDAFSVSWSAVDASFEVIKV